MSTFISGQIGIFISGQIGIILECDSLSYDIMTLLLWSGCEAKRCLRDLDGFLAEDVCLYLGTVLAMMF